MDFKTSRYLVYSDILDDNDPNQKRILYATRSGATMLVDASLYDNIQKQNYNDIEELVLSRLLDYEVIVPKEEDEFQEMLLINNKGLMDTNTLAPTIQTTANCQLGCFYCGQVHTKNTMPEDIKDKVLQRLETKLVEGGYKHLGVTWYGGEPLMGYSTILDISNHLKQLAKDNNVGYDGYIITNGLSLKPKIFEELYINQNVTTFQITIDTTKEHHDKRRITKEGNSTFDIILNNIVEITQLPFYQQKSSKPIFIRMNIDSSNYKSVPTFIDLLAEKGLSDKVSLGFSPITNWGDVTAGDEIALTADEFSELEIEWYLYAISKDFNISNLIPNRDYSVCMVVMKDSEVYDAYGNIQPCYEFSYTPLYDNKESRIGNLKDDESTYDYDIKIKSWYKDLQEGKEGQTYCKNCNLFPVCNGACPKKWLYGEHGCPPMKKNITDRLILQYMMDKTNIKSLI